MTGITKEELGRSYAIATTRIHKLTASFYEDLFNRLGSPREHPAQIGGSIHAFRQQVNYELDLIKEASLQYHEANDQQQQEGLFGLDGKSS